MADGAIQIVQVRGLDEVRQNLSLVPIKLQRQLLRRALRAGAQVFVRDIKANAPRRTGALIRNVYAKAARDKRGFADRYIIGVRHGKARLTPTTFVAGGKVRVRGLTAYDRRGEDPYYYRFQELGFTAVGRRRQASRQEDRARASGRGSYGRKVPGKRFITNAANNRAKDALEAFRDTIRAGLEQALA
jgi:HK97 gp10 family phage protein